MTILVVDDNADIRMLIGFALGSAGFTVEHADSGNACLHRVQRGDPPDGIILDLQMPGMDGWQTLERLRRMHRAAHIPVILCTVKSDAKDEARGWALGCDGYIRKPFDSERLAGDVQRVLELSLDERRRAREAAMSVGERPRE